MSSADPLSRACSPPLPPKAPPRATSPTSNERKYATTNPIVRYLVARFLERLGARVALLGPRRIVDLGAGEGHVAEALARALPYPFTYHGLELNPDAVAAAQQRWRGEGARAAASAGSDVRFEQADLLARAPDEGWADVALCLEVLEHLQQPERAVARLHDWTSAFAIVSVPHEPYFRLGSLLRGKYVRTLGNHPEHCQHFDARSLAALMKTAFATVQVESRFPWLIAVARRAPPWGTRGPPG